MDRELFLTKMVERVYKSAITTDDIVEDYEDRVDRGENISEMRKSKWIPVEFIECVISELQMAEFKEECKIAEEKRKQEERDALKKPYKKFLFIEDGSVDIDELELRLADSNPEIKIVVFRNGAMMPQLVEVEDGKTDN